LNIILSCIPLQVLTPVKDSIFPKVAMVSVLDSRMAITPWAQDISGLAPLPPPNTAVGAYLLLGNDSAAKTNSFGLAGKYMSYFAQKDRLHLYGFGQLSIGKNGGEANKGRDDTLFGLAGGVGLEFVLLKDFSVSGEAGLGFNTLPDGKNAYATGTGKLAVNFYY
jgi:hypothetical protein